MRLDRLDAAGLARFDAALRAEEPVWLVGTPSCEVPLQELVPLCHGVTHEGLQPWLPPAAQGGGGPAVSVVIPTHRHRPLGLTALLGQDLPVEVHVLANGPEAPERVGPVPAGVTVQEVPWEGHGRTRQRGVEACRHDYVLVMVDDARPLGAGFLRTLVSALDEGGYDAVIARQLPWPSADAVTRSRLRAWTPMGSEHRPWPELDNVCALYRREALLADPFDAVDIAEDWVWGRRHRIGYEPRAAVLHSHPRTFRALYTRTRDIHRVMHAHGAAPQVPSTAAMLQALPSVLGSDLRGGLGELLGQWAARRPN